MAAEEQLDIKKIIRAGSIQNELDFERALIAERKMRLLAKENPQYIVDRKKLRDIIETWEKRNWSPDSAISEEKIRESDLAEEIAVDEMHFMNRRKKIIREKLHSYGLTQQDLGVILGHNNKSYISELMNGLIPFSIKDLIYIHRLFKIDLKDLIPTFLSHDERIKIKISIDKLNKPKLKLNKDDLALV
jgi:transcriptional regulator with XRE-family HTH domain